MVCMKIEDVNLKGNFSVNRLAQNDYLKFLRKKLNVQTESARYSLTDRYKNSPFCKLCPFDSNKWGRGAIKTFVE